MHQPEIKAFFTEQSLAGLAHLWIENYVSDTNRTHKVGLYRFSYLLKGWQSNYHILALPLSELFTADVRNEQVGHKSLLRYVIAACLILDQLGLLHIHRLLVIHLSG